MIFNLFITLILLTGTLHAQEFWEKSDDSFNESIFALIINDSGHIFAGTSSPPFGTTGGVFRSKDNGDSWTEINNGLTRLFVRSLAINTSGQIFAGTNENGIFRSTDNGENWVETNVGLANLNINTIAINDSGHIFAGIDENGIYRSLDNGATWIEKNNGITSQQILSFAINSRGVIFAGASTTFGDGIYRSYDNGNNWTKITANYLELAVPSLAINSDGVIFAATHRGLIRSTDDGNSWEAADSGVAWSEDLRGLAINSNGDIFVRASSSLYSGVYRSVNNGESWEELNTNFIDAKLARTFTFTSTGHIFAGTSNGVYRSLESTIGIKEIEFNLPTEFSLYQNYPNPFNPVTEIEYSLPRSGKISLVVYDILGEEVTRLVGENQQSGYHTVTWNATNLASGIYFYRLQATKSGGDFVQTRKMMLLK